ncbi:hypothetical protein QYE76_060207 [Lolium multiflorum]|uniref:FBD domain-containing protein n=1 Tax=Lolium multiflorum TaxID=4521 RepID=A0AAD8S1R1_LOLMU|nr:hypothetical protein QYE76_060207 [Lolium multiflorum]
MAAQALARDLISNQPDAVLGTIVSLLPTKDGCRTQGLSRRWRHIWRSAPLNLAAGRRDRRGQLPAYDFSKVLSSHLGPVRRIHIIGIGPLWYRTRHEVIGEAGGDARIDGWVGSPRVLAGLEVLDIAYSYYGEVLPPSVFRLAPVLRVASFSRCRLPANLAVDLPSLEKLGLYNIFLTEEALCALLSGCPALRSLRTNLDTWGYRSRLSNHLPKYMENVRKYALPDDPVECLEFHLKKVAIKVYCGMGMEVEFARFFVLNGKVIEKMEFGLVDDPKDDLRVTQNTLLQLEDRASRDARFEFKSSIISSILDVDRDDPCASLPNTD